MKQTVDWHQHWTRKSPGFHEARVNTYLERFLPLFNLQPGDRVFLPLCGKAHDILWLSRQGLDVIGVEISQVAVESFFEEAGLKATPRQQGPFTVYQAPNITLYQGDYMHLQPSDLQGCQLVYDRAAIVAIEPFNRASYVEHMLKIIPRKSPFLLVTLEYEQSVMSGPPFSVPVSEIEQHFSSTYRVEHLLTNEQIDERPRWRELGLTSFKETALRLVTNND